MADTKPRPRLMRGNLVIPFTLKEDLGWPEVTGTISPVTVAEWREHIGELNAPGLSVREQTEIMNRFYASRIKSWNVIGDDDKSEAVTPETVGLLPPPQWVQLKEAIITNGAAAVLGKSAVS